MGRPRQWSTSNMGCGRHFRAALAQLWLSFCSAYAQLGELGGRPRAVGPSRLRARENAPNGGTHLTMPLINYVRPHMLAAHREMPTRAGHMCTQRAPKPTHWPPTALPLLRHLSVPTRRPRPSASSSPPKGAHCVGYFSSEGAKWAAKAEGAGRPSPLPARRLGAAPEQTDGQRAGSGWAAGGWQMWRLGGRASWANID